MYLCSLDRFEMFHDSAMDFVVAVSKVTTAIELGGLLIKQPVKMRALVHLLDILRARDFRVALSLLAVLGRTRLVGHSLLELQT